MPSLDDKKELLRKIRADELKVIVCGPGPTPIVKRLNMATVLRECALCHQVIHMAADNVEAAAGMTPICVPCYMAELMPESPLEQCQTLMGGQKLTFEEGIKTAVAMLKDNDPSN